MKYLNILGNISLFKAIGFYRSMEPIKATHIAVGKITNNGTSRHELMELRLLFNCHSTIASFQTRLSFSGFEASDLALRERLAGKTFDVRSKPMNHNGCKCN